MRGLGGSMNNERNLASVTLKDLHNCALVSNVDIVVFVCRDGSLDPLEVGSRRRFITEERSAHVVVDPYNMESLLRKVGNGLGADKARRTRYNCDAHRSLSTRNVLGVPIASKPQNRSLFCVFKVLVRPFVVHQNM